MKKGVMFAFLTAIISGISIFINKFAVSGVNSSVFTGLKALIVSLFLISVMFAFSELKELKKLTRKDYLKLFAVGLIGGSIPFLLFFKGLQLTSALNASFIHKTMFLWVALLAAIFLKERLNKRWFVAAVLILAGNILLLRMTNWSWNIGDFLILGATFFWASENILSKHLLKKLSTRIVVSGRMFFGSLIILTYLGITGQITQVVGIGLTNIFWILLTSIFLFFYVSSWYNALKYTKASTATSILMFGSVVTALLSYIFLNKVFVLSEILGILLITGGMLAITRIRFSQPQTQSE
jgi:drug/metabolite transporter (DMT)-like permease